MGKLLVAIVALFAVTSIYSGCGQSSGEKPSPGQVVSEKRPTFEPAPLGQASPTATPLPSATPAEPTPSPTPARPYTELVTEGLRASQEGAFRAKDTGWLRGSFSDLGASTMANTCAEGVDCRIKYIQVVLGKPTAMGTCSGVRIAKDLVLTNRHCVRLITEQPNSGFDGSGFAVLPKNPSDPWGETTSISNLVLISPKNVAGPIAGPDWAILKLLVQAPPFAADVPVPKINRDGFKDGESYFVYAPSPYANASNPLAIEKRECKAVYRTIFAPSFDRPLNTVVAFAGCPIGPGNSGAPIYNKDGELVGIIAGQFVPATMEALSLIAATDFGLLASPQFGHVGFGMNMACIPDLDSPAPLPEDCNAGFGQKSAKVTVSDDLAKTAIDRLTALPQPSEKFEFRAVPAVANERQAIATLAQVLFVQAPECVKPDVLRSLTNDDLKFKANFAGVALSQEGSLLPRLAPLQSKDAKLILDLEVLKTRGEAEYELDLVSDRMPLHLGKLTTCPD